VRAGPKPQPKTSKLPRLRARTPSARFAEFCRRFLVHGQGPLAGQALALARWQRDRIIRPLFDTRSQDGRRVYRTCYVTVPRKNGKSTLASAIALYLLYADREPGAEIVAAASDRAQASIVFDAARRMVEAAPALADMTLIYRRELVVPSTGSRFRVISSDAPRQHGLNLSAAIIDELHAHQSRELFDALTTATGARPQPVTFIITTAGADPHHIAAEVHDYAVKVRDGVIPDPTFLPVIYAAPADADPWDERVWFACNPALDDFRSLEEFRTAARQAKEVPGREAAFRRLYLNQWGAAIEQRWLSLPAWDACASAAAPPGATIAGGAATLIPPRARAFVGLDLSTTTDLTALALVAPDGAGGYAVAVDFFCPADTIADRERRDRVPYATWASQGHLQPTPGNVVDYSHVEARVRELVQSYDVVEIACDPWNARDLLVRLQRDVPCPVVEVPQTMIHLTGASKALEKLILSQRLRHDGNPVLRWCVSNAVADVDGNGNVKPSKKRSRERIDGVSALVTALSRALLDPGASVYESRGPLVVDL
jgi:phage terminase large subunit-like protein